MSSTGLAPRDYSNASPQLALVTNDAPGNDGIGDEHDFYRTPAWVTRAILPHLPAFVRVEDPCAGDGAILEAVRAWSYEADPHLELELGGLEIDEARADSANRKGFDVRALDALAPHVTWPLADLFILNPPFSLAEEFVRSAIAAAKPQRAHVAVLLRAAFIESAERVALHREHPSDLYPLASRPSFIDRDALRPCPRCDGGKRPRVDEPRCTKCRGKGAVKGGSDSSAYAWFVWGPGRGGRWRVLDDVDPNKKRRGKKG